MGMFSRKPNIKKLKEKRDIEGLIEAAGHISVGVFEPARNALGNIIDESEAAGDVETITKIYQAAITHRISPVVAKAISTLSKIKDKRSVEPLIQTLRDPMCPSDVTAGEIIPALGDINDERAVKPLIEVFSRKYVYFDPQRDSSYFLRNLAVEALAKMKEKAVGPLIEALIHPGDWNVGDDSTVWNVRRYAARALYENKDKSMVEPLIRFLKDRESNEKLRHKLYEGLSETDIMIYNGKTKDEIVATLLGQLHTDIINALGETKDERVVKLLIGILGKGEDIELRRASVYTLGEIGDERAVEPLNKILKSEAKDSYLSRSVEEALEKIHQKRG